LKNIKIIIVLFTFLLCMNVRITVEGIEESQAEKLATLASPKMENTVRGAVEDLGWMTAESKQEVYSLLRRYFGGNLLDDLTEKCWDFIKEPTDWYSVAKLTDLKVLSNDGKRAVVEALIRIEDVDTGYTETGKGLFTMKAVGEEWIINYMDIHWVKQGEKSQSML